MTTLHGSSNISCNVIWRAALKSERFSPRRRLIMRMCAATRPDATEKSICPQIRRLVDIALLKVLEGEMRLQKIVLLRSFAANTRGADNG
jgi:hypothetical protein